MEDSEQTRKATNFLFALDDARFSDRVLILTSPLRPTSLVDVSPSAGQVVDGKSMSMFSDINGNVSDTGGMDGSERAVLKRIRVSSVLLASDSRFFKSLLTNGMIESKQKEIEIQVEDDRECEHMAALLRFLYTGELSLNCPDLNIDAISTNSAATTRKVPVAEGISPSRDDLVSMLHLADRFQMESAVSKCCQLLALDTTVDACAHYLMLPESLALSDGCKELIDKSKSLLADAFKDLDAHWDKDRFLQLNGAAVCAVLASNVLETRSENTVFQAVKRWWLQSPLSPGRSPMTPECSVHIPEKNQNLWQEERKEDPEQSVETTRESIKLALSLIRSVRFPMLSADFLLDVVKHDETFFPYSMRCGSCNAAFIQKKQDRLHTVGSSADSVAFLSSPVDDHKRDKSAQILLPRVSGDVQTTRSKLSDSCGVRSLMGNLVADAIAFHAFSARRKQVQPFTQKILTTRRTGSANPATVCYYWKIEKLSSLREGKYIFSPSFFVDGYFFRLQVGKIKWERNDDYAFAIFLSLDLNATGLACDRGFFVQAESQFWVKSVHTAQFDPTHLPSFDVFTAGVRELGYFDVFKRVISPFALSTVVPWCVFVYQSWSELTGTGTPYVDHLDAISVGVKVRLLV